MPKIYEKYEKACPKCTETVNTHAIVCPHCQSNISESIHLHEIDLQDDKSILVLTEKIKTKIWHDSLKVILGSAFSLMILGGVFSVVQKYLLTNEITKDLQAVKEEVTKDVTKAVKKEALASVEKSVSDIETKLPNLKKSITNARIKLTAFEIESSNILDSVKEQAIYLESMLEAAEGDTEKMSRLLAKNEGTLDKVAILSKKLQGQTRQLESKLVEAKSELDGQIKQGKAELSTFENKVKELNLRADGISIEAKGIIEQVESLRKLSNELKNSLATQQNRSSRFVTVEALNKRLEGDNGKKKLMPKPVVVSPASRGLDFIQTYYGEELFFQWQSAEKSGTSYLVEISTEGWDSNNKEQGEHVVFSARIKDVKKDVNLCKESMSDICSGVFFWRVGTINGGETIWSDTEKFEFYESALERIRKTQSIRVAISDGNTGIKENNGQFTGFEPDFSNAIARKLLPRTTSQPEVIFVQSPWEDIFNVLKKNQVDMIISSVSILDSRRPLHNIEFSESYFKSTISAVMTDTAYEDNELKVSLKDKVVAVEDKTYAALLVQSQCDQILCDKVLKVKSITDVIEKVSSGEADVGVYDTPQGQDVLAKVEHEAVEKLIAQKYSDDNWGVVVSRDEKELLKSINTSIKTLRQEKALDRLEGKYFMSKEDG